MGTWTEGILINLISDVIFLMIVAAVALLVFRWTRGRQLCRFYGVKRGSAVTVCLSDLANDSAVKEALGSAEHGAMPLYDLPVVPFKEVLAASSFCDLFSSPRTALEDKGVFTWARKSDVKVEIVPSPHMADVPQFVRELSSVIAVGSPAYNPTSHYIERSFPAGVHFQVSESIPGSRYHGEAAIAFHDISMINDGNFHYGFVQRSFRRSVESESNPCTFFYLAGINEYGTVGAVRYLAGNWRRLYKRYGPDQPFWVVLRFHAGQDHGRVHLEGGPDSLEADGAQASPGPIPAGR